MFCILHGEDDFSLHEELARIREGLGDRSLADTNTVVLQGQSLSPEPLMAACDTIPFLAEKRLVIVEGLLGRFEQPARGKRPRKDEGSRWNPLKDYCDRLPGTTVLVLVEGKLSRDNPMLKMLGPAASVREFKPLSLVQLRSWLQRRLKDQACSISPKARELLISLVGSNLHILSREVDKLCLYARGRTIEEGDVRTLVPDAREASVFSMIDAILDRQPSTAMRLLHALEEEGSAPAYLLFMITRQFRLVMQAKDLLLRKKQPVEVGRMLRMPNEFVRDRTLQQARKHSMELLRDVYLKLLDTDLSIKTGKMKGDKGELALSLLVAELSGAVSS
ncbi:MAG: DNA polymerase III subunit delta [Dehalococcoidia bacterium]|nr:DNA polymerase III subunit delta [Dehalococcoidia bacterium]